VKIKEIKVLPKPGESIYFKGNRVIKHFDDEKIVRDRVERAKILKGIVPEIIKSSRNSYAYKFVDGELISKISDVQKFREFLDFCAKKLWKKKTLSSAAKREFLEKTKKFYLDKTKKRVEKFYEETGIKDRPIKINGRKRPTLASLLKKVDWNKLSRGVPVLFHGDLQPENILVTKKSFKLLDWRHDFEGLKEYGDIYYDLSKLYHALIVSHEVIRKEEYSVSVSKDVVNLNFLIKNNLLEFKDIFDRFLVKKGYDLEKVRVLSALIYLNIAPLHHSPYNVFLYYLGVDYLANALD
jgi:thiamine kinase-like enzyme